MKPIAIGILAAMLAMPALGQTQGVDVTIDSSAPGAEINRNIFGQFAEQALGRGIYDGIWVGEKSKIANIRGYRRDVVDALKAIHVPVVRWPGGCFGDVYDWRDGIGPRAKRPITLNRVIYTENNTVGTHEYFDLMDILGSDAYVSVNVGSGSPMDAAHWVEYMTSDKDTTLTRLRAKNGHPKPWTLKYVGIGNELWGCGGQMSAEYVSDVSKRYAQFINAPASMGMTKIFAGPNGAGTNGTNANVLNYTATMMQKIPNMAMLSIHLYAVPHSRPAGTPQGAPFSRGPSTGFDEQEYALTLSKGYAMEPLLTDLSKVMDKTDPGKRTGLAIDEWGTWYDHDVGESYDFQQNTMRDAEVAALTLNSFQRHTDRVKMSNIAQMINLLQSMILTKGDKMIVTPTYHIYDMYQPFMGATPYPAHVTQAEYRYGDYHVPQVDVSAARGKDGKLYLAIVNTDPHNAVDVRTSLTGSAAGRILTGNAMDAHNDFAHPNTVRPVPFQGTTQDGKLVFKMPALAIAVVAVQ